MSGITKKEAIIQCALGTLTRRQLVEKAQQSKDTDFLTWAIGHPKVSVRTAAVKNSATPIRCLLDRVTQERTGLKDLILKILRERYPEVKKVLRHRG